MKKILIFICIVVLVLPYAKCQSYNNAEREAIEKLRARVQHLITESSHKYQLEDAYLYLWLDSKNFNVEDAEKFFIKNLKWRKEQNMESILNETEMDNLSKILKVNFDEFSDKSGNPALLLNYGSWNIRKLILMGKFPQLKRFNQFMIESAIRDARRANTTKFNILAQLNNFNIREHACLLCINYAVHFVTILEEHYPGQINSVIAINSPKVFDVLLDVIRPLLAARTAKKLKVFGVNKNEWQQFIGELYNLDQLPTQFGGNKKT